MSCRVDRNCRGKQSTFHAARRELLRLLQLPNLLWLQTFRYRAKSNYFTRERVISPRVSFQKVSFAMILSLCALFHSCHIHAQFSAATTIKHISESTCMASSQSPVDGGKSVRIVQRSAVRSSLRQCHCRYQRRSLSFDVSTTLPQYTPLILLSSVRAVHDHVLRDSPLAYGHAGHHHPLVGGRSLLPMFCLSVIQNHCRISGRRSIVAHTSTCTAWI